MQRGEGFHLFFKVWLRNLPAVKKLGRIVGFTLGAIVAVAAVVLLAVNLYVQSQGTQARIQHELSQRLETPLVIRRISVTPWGGLKLSGITIPQSVGAPGNEFLRAKTFGLHIHFPSLFSQRLVIKEISLVEPTVVWAQNADGKWRLPPLPASGTAETPPDQQHHAAPAASAPPPENPAQVPAPPQPTAAASAPATTEHATAEEGGFVPEIRRVNLLGGRFEFLDEHGKPVATFADVQFRSNFRNAADVRGNISIATTSLRDRFFLQKLHSHLAYGPAALELGDVQADAAGGQMAGRFSMQPQTADSPFSVSVKFQRLDADRVVTEAGGPGGTISGRLEGFLEATGRTADPNALAGSGEIVLRAGQLRQYSLLDALGQLLQIEELRQLKLEEAHVKYHISPGVVIVDELLLRSPNIRLSAAGTVKFDGALHLESQLAINDQIRKQLFRPLRENFQPLDEAGFAGLKFTIGGSVERPKTDLMDKLVGRDLKDIGSVINSFLGGKSDRSKKRKPAPAGSPADAAPDPASAPAAPDTTPVPSATP